MGLKRNSRKESIFILYMLFLDPHKMIDEKKVLQRLASDPKIDYDDFRTILAELSA